MEDTIAAIATGPGDSGIGIVRISGKDALVVADKIFVSKDAKKPSAFKTYTLHYGHIANPGLGRQREVIDEVILAVMRGPRSFTREDTVEINCHGGIVAMRAVLDLVLTNGCRMAEPGEFTKRAFLNGRIDLTQAEAVLDIIRAKTDNALKIGSRQLQGVLSGYIENIRKDLLDALSVIEANIDFPEEEIGAVDFGSLEQSLSDIDGKLRNILGNSKYGRIMREGISAVICGSPNVGKSSLLNALLREERSIVTPIAGTTRDTIEEIIDIRGIPVKIVDTAGILEPRDLVEKKAVLRSKKYIDTADLVIIVFDAGKKLDKNDRVVMNKLKRKKAIAVINKIDLRQKIDKCEISQKFGFVVEMSAKRLTNINLLEDAIENMVYKKKIMYPEASLVVRSRHIEKLRFAQKFIAQAADSLDNRLSLEFIAQDIKDAIVELDELLGKSFSGDLLDEIFGSFCIGK